MQNGYSEPGAAGQSPRKSSPLKRSDPVKRSSMVPLSVKAAAAALLRAVENEQGDIINRVVVTRNFGPRVYVKSSLVMWRSEAEARDGIIPDHDREEFSYADNSMTRNDLEHPEQAYRRGFQQGAGAVYHALKKANLLSERLRERLSDFVYWKVYWWRFGKRRRLERNLCKDAAPRLELSDAWRRL